MKNIFYILLSLCFGHNAFATNYYFSSATGDDARTSIEAQDPSTPWQSIKKLNTISGSLQPGDSVLFKRGETFYGSITVQSSGLDNRVIYYGAFGVGANPVISGFSTLSTWSMHSAGIYFTTLDMPNLNMVTINGEAKGKGRYPNTGYLNYENHSRNTSITDNELPSSPSWTGAEVVIRKLRYILDRHTVISHSGTTLNYSTSTVNGNNSAYSPVKGNGYFIQNHLGTLDQFGEWFYDNEAKRLYVYFGTGMPSDYVVKASTKETNLSVSTLSNFKIEALNFEGANTKGLNLVNVSNTTILDCNFYNQGGSAIYGIDLNGVTVKGGSINTSFSNGVFYEYNCNNSTIDGVLVNSTNHVTGSGRSGDAVGIGIMVYGNHSTITNNRVFNTGYNGIQFIGNNVLVEKNFVDRFCFVKDDGGGIYTYTGSSGTTNSNRIVRNNVILNAIGAYPGAEGYNYEPFGKAAGIYLDEYANHTEIAGNTIADGDWGGILLHNAHTNTISRNLIYNFRDQVHVTQYAAATRNNTVTDNQFIAKQSTQNTFLYKTYVADNPSTMGVFDRNYYARPMDDNATIRIDNYWTGGNGTSYISLAQWKASYSLDATSQRSPLIYSSNIEENLRFEYNETGAEKTVTLNNYYIDVMGTPYSEAISLAPFSGIVLFKTTTLHKLTQTITFPAIGNKVYDEPPFTLEASSTSGLLISYRVVSGPATVSGNVLTLTGAGQVTVEASQAGNGTYNAATPVSQSFTVFSTKQKQTITFPTIANKTYGNPPFDLSATASSGLPVSYRVVSGPATVSGSTVTITGAGTVTIEAMQAGSTLYNVATPVRQSFTVAKATQTITFPAISAKTYGTPPFALNATASSGLTVSYSMVSGPATISGNMVTITGVGTVTIKASQAGNQNYTAASSVNQSFTVAKAIQTITFPAIPDKVYGDPAFSLNATASSGLSISYRVVSGPAKINGSTVTLTGTGTVTIRASQGGNTNYNAAPNVERTFTVFRTKQNQTITFAPIPTKTYGDATFLLSATASSGLLVSFTVLSGPASVSGNTITITGAGTVTVQASQAGNTTYNAATPVNQSFVVNKAGQTINFPAMENKTFGEAPFSVNASASSGLTVSFRVSQGPATINGTVVTLTGAGTVIMEAVQEGNVNFTAAVPVTQSFTVAKASQLINFPPISDKTVGDAPFTLSATATSGLVVTYQIVSGVATLEGNTVTVKGEGSVVIEAIQAGDNNYNAAPPVRNTFNVAPAATEPLPTSTKMATNRTLSAPLATEAVQLSVFPVPMYKQGFVRIITAEATTGMLAIYDAAGRMVQPLGKQSFSKGADVQIRLNTQNLTRGIYFVSFVTDYGTLVKAFEKL